MMYFRGDQFYPFAIDWKEQSNGRIVVPGLGIYFLDPKEGKWNIDDVTAEMQHTRNLQMGYAFFRNKFLLDNKQGILDFTKRFNAYPALVPPMTWASDRIPGQPQNLNVTTAGGWTSVTWDNPTRYTDKTPITTPYIYNNVYASREYPVDVSDARNLIATRYLGKSIQLEQKGGEPLYFAITSMDGYGIESQATQENQYDIRKYNYRYGAARMLVCDGDKLYLGEIAKNLDSEILLVQSLQGNTIRRYLKHSNKLDISNLSNGVYILKSLNKRGVEHTLGTFFKKKN